MVAGRGCVIIFKERSAAEIRGAPELHSLELGAGPAGVAPFFELPALPWLTPPEGLGSLKNPIQLRSRCIPRELAAVAKAIPSLLFFAGLWWLLSGHADALLLSLGAASVVLVWSLSRRMTSVGISLKPGSSLLTYLAWLMKEIVLSNLEVCREILRPRLAISPTLARVPASQTTPWGRTLYANSITLTPGTVSIEVGEHDVLIHALLRKSAESLMQADMDRRVKALEA